MTVTITMIVANKTMNEDKGGDDDDDDDDGGGGGGGGGGGDGDDNHNDSKNRDESDMRNEGKLNFMTIWITCRGAYEKKERTRGEESDWLVETKRSVSFINTWNKKAISTILCKRRLIRIATRVVMVVHLSESSRRNKAIAGISMNMHAAMVACQLYLSPERYFIMVDVTAFALPPDVARLAVGIQFSPRGCSCITCIESRFYLEATSVAQSFKRNRDSCTCQLRASLIYLG